MKNPFSNLFKKKSKEGQVPAPPTSVKKKKSGFFDKFLKNRIGKQAALGEEIVGVELTPDEIRLAQLSSNKSNQWVLDKFFVHKVEGMPEGGTVLDNPDLVGEQLQVALLKSKISTTNAAIAIPVTSAIIRVVTAPLLSDEELKKAIETDSIWEKLVQLTDKMADYSIFHQVINRDEKANTMDLLFVAAKLSDINSYT